MSAPPQKKNGVADVPPASPASAANERSCKKRFVRMDISQFIL